MKNYILLIFSDGCEPLLNEITPQNTFDDFDKAFEMLESHVAEEWPMVEVPKPNKIGAFNFSHKGDHFQLWETNIPERKNNQLFN